jgi:hypothetical protein
MIVDALLAVCGSITGNTVTGANMFGSSATVTSPNVVDLSQNRDVGEGQDLFVRFQVTTAFAGGTSAQFQAVVADDAGITTNVTVVGAGKVLPVATLALGYRDAFKLNPNIGSLGRRYFAIQAVNAGANTAGAVYADLGAEVADNKVYPSGFAVL